MKNETKTRVLVFRLSSLGDLILSTSVLSSPRNFEITWVVAMEFQDIVNHHPKVNRVVAVDRKALSLGKWLKLCWNLAGEPIDQVWDLHGSLRTGLASIVFWLRRPQVEWRSVSKQRFRRLLFFVFKQILPSALRPWPWIRRYQKFLNHAGAVPNLRHLIRSPNNRLDHASKGIGMMPSSKWRGKEWPVEEFLELARQLASSAAQTRPILVFGEGHDDRANELFEKLNREKIRSERILGNLGELADSLIRCERLITNDTGMGHYAEALGVPVSILFGPTHPDLGFGPFRSESRSIEKDLNCRPCSKDGQICVRFWEPYACLKGLRANEVFKQLAEPSVYVPYERATLRATVWRRVWRFFLHLSGNSRVVGSAQISLSKKKPIWIHASSVGELEMVWPVAMDLARKTPVEKRAEMSWVVTNWSASADRAVIRLAEELKGLGCQVIYSGRSPREGNWRASFQAIRPKLFLTAKYEAWPELWCSLSELHIPLVLIEALDRSSLRWVSRILGWLGTPQPELLMTTDSLTEQSKLSTVFPSAKFLQELNPRWDRVRERQSPGGNGNNEATLRWAQTYRDRPRPWWILASVYREDFDKFGPIFNSFSGTVWVFPHHLKGPHFDQLKGHPEFQSLLKKGVFVDEMGVLTSFFGHCDLAYVGGGWNRSIHSTLEPAAAGLPVACGPKGVKKFPEAVRLLNQGVLTVVTQPEQLQKWSLRENKRHAPDQSTYGVSDRVVRWVLDSMPGVIDL